MAIGRYLKLNWIVMIFGVAVLGVAALLGVVLRPEWWAWVLLIGAGIVVALVGGIRLGDRLEPQPPPRPFAQSTTQPPVVRATQVSLAATEIPSSMAGYQFVLTATVSWEPAGGGLQHGDPGAVAKDAVIDRAIELSRQLSPTESTRAAERLGAALGSRRADPDRQVWAWATDVSIAIGQKDASRLTELQELRKSSELWNSRRGYEQNVRAYLGDDVLTSGGSALVWWLARHIDDVDDAVDSASHRIGTLLELSTAAQRRDASHDLGRDDRQDHLKERGGRPAESATPVGEAGTAPRDVDLARGLITALFPEPTARRTWATQQLADFAEQWERPDLAADLRADTPTHSDKGSESRDSALTTEADPATREPDGQDPSKDPDPGLDDDDDMP